MRPRVLLAALVLAGAFAAAAGGDVPSLSIPSDMVVEGNTTGGANVTFSYSGTNADGTPPTVSCTPDSPSFFALGGPHTVNCSATDSFEAPPNSLSRSFHVTVVDTTAPTISGTPSDITAEGDTVGGRHVTYSAPTASDTVDASPSVSCAPASGSLFGVGTTTVTCTAQDASNNTSTSSFHVTITDTQKPTIAGTPGDVSYEGDTLGGKVVTFSTPTASDVVDGSDPVTCAPASGSLFGVGTTQVTCSAQDQAGNHADATHFNVTVNDTTAPQISGASPQTVEATGPSGASVSFSPTASDIVAGSVPVVCAPASGSTFALGTTAVSCSASDGHGNTGHAGFNVTVQDTTPPQLSGVPGHMVLEAQGPSGATLSYAKPTATDLVSGSVAVNCSPASGAVAPIGNTNVTCSATDGHGNSATAGFGVLVQDTTPPSVVSPGDLVVAATGPSGAVVNYPLPSGSDVVGPVFTRCAPSPDTLFPLGTTPVSCVVSDGAGNSATVAFNVVVVIKSTILQGLPPDQTAEATGPDGAAVSFNAPAGASCKPASGSKFPVGVTNVTCEAGSQAGTFTVTVRDTTPPAFGPGGRMFVKDVNAAASVPVEYPVPTATDRVDGKVQVICKPQPGSEFKLGTSKVTCTARDKQGNASAEALTIQVRDRIKPPPVGALQVHLHGRDATVEWKLPPGNDAVSAVVVRKPGTKGSKPSVLYRGPHTSVTDHGLKKGVHYEYDVYAVDRAQNESGVADALAAIPDGELTAPFDGERFSVPPLLVWLATDGADYYNVQLWLVTGKTQKKVLSIWPTTTHLQLGGEWDFHGSHYRLEPGLYRWYVWPGFGPLAKAKYGKLKGSATFVVLGP